MHVNEYSYPASIARIWYLQSNAATPTVTGVATQSTAYTRPNFCGGCCARLAPNSSNCIHLVNAFCPYQLPPTPSWPISLPPFSSHIRLIISLLFIQQICWQYFSLVFESVLFVSSSAFIHFRVYTIARPPVNPLSHHPPLTSSRYYAAFGIVINVVVFTSRSLTILTCMLLCGSRPTRWVVGFRWKPTYCWDTLPQAHTQDSHFWHDMCTNCMRESAWRREN